MTDDQLAREWEREYHRTSGKTMNVKVDRGWFYTDTAMGGWAGPQRRKAVENCVENLRKRPTVKPL